MRDTGLLAESMYVGRTRSYIIVESVPGIGLVVLAGCCSLRPRKKLGLELNLSVHLQPDEQIPGSPFRSLDSRSYALHFEPVNLRSEMEQTSTPRKSARCTHS